MYLQHRVPPPCHEDCALVSISSLALHGQEAQATHTAEVFLKGGT